MPHATLAPSAAVTLVAPSVAVDFPFHAFILYSGVLLVKIFQRVFVQVGRFSLIALLVAATAVAVDLHPQLNFTLLKPPCAPVLVSVSVPAPAPRFHVHLELVRELAAPLVRPEHVADHHDNGQIQQLKTSLLHPLDPPVENWAYPLVAGQHYAPNSGKNRSSVQQHLQVLVQPQLYCLFVFPQRPNRVLQAVENPNVESNVQRAAQKIEPAAPSEEARNERVRVFWLDFPLRSA